MTRRLLERVRAQLQRGAGDAHDAPGLSAEAVTWSYRLFLDREPESARVVREKQLSSSTTRELRAEFLASDEFRGRNGDAFGARTPTLWGDEPAMTIERVSGAALDRLFAHIQTTWQQLGESEPFWSVWSDERFKQGKLEAQSKADFYQSGRIEVEVLLKTLARNGVEMAGLRSCLEYGCGLGRITPWLASHFEHVHGYDISRAHLNGADEYFRQQQISNVTLHHVRSIRDLEQLPKVDVIYSAIVLQHNPPPIIREIVTAFIRALNPGGVAFFQVPTYRSGYRFVLDEYLTTDGTRHEMEMHVLPQRDIFEIVRRDGGQLLEVLEDSRTGMRPKERSNTFVVQRAP
jgi:2-polyprenyl-3-methyl-5-hydroxy-6-metoxy-1,4-benzoquinol methylase